MEVIFCMWCRYFCINFWLFWVETFCLIMGSFFVAPYILYSYIMHDKQRPFTHYQPWCSWWFVTCYLELLLIAPFINHIINENNKKSHLFLIISLTIINVYFGFICQTNEGRTGYTLMNFCYLYILGRYM